MAGPLGVNRSMAREIVAQYIRVGRVRERPRGGRNNVLVDVEMSQRLEDIINENCVVTLSQINGELRRSLPAKPQFTGLVNVRKECCFVLNWFGPFQQTETNVMFCKKGRIWRLVHEPCHYAPLCGYNMWTARNHGRVRQGGRALREVCGQQGRNVTVALAVSPFNSLVFHSAYIGGMNAPCCYDFLAQTRQNLDPNEEVILFYDGAPAHRNPAIPACQYRAGDAPGLKPGACQSQ